MNEKFYRTNKCFKDAKSVTIPSSITEIGEDVFEGCSSLLNVTLGDDFEKVPPEWFDCSDKFNGINPLYEIICTKDSPTYNAIKQNEKLRVHLKSQ
ncbi:MAG: leucine-rich repeat protein [Treponema sp.]|nr:leucine-rich repeat protein [Treponema sp.]MBR4628890.1 leucine-rich repeat protein [Treponema sp.]MBR6914004.1 leucine-rich repeat protein [Treponema sp.]